MFFKLLLAFIFLPIAEIYLLIKLGTAIGALNTIVVVILTAVAGAYLAQQEGIKTTWQIRSSLEHGRMPTEELTNALLIFIAGLVLLTPGFLTDLVGLLLLVPQSRGFIKKKLKKMFEHKVSRQHIDVHFQ
jgi:UPF0716 protein FxsA